MTKYHFYCNFYVLLLLCIDICSIVQLFDIIIIMVILLVNLRIKDTHAAGAIHLVCNLSQQFVTYVSCNVLYIRHVSSTLYHYLFPLASFHSRAYILQDWNKHPLTHHFGLGRIMILLLTL